MRWKDEKEVDEACMAENIMPKTKERREMRPVLATTPVMVGFLMGAVSIGRFKLKRSDFTKGRLNINIFKPNF